jgi:hypothetical protein
MQPQQQQPQQQFVLPRPPPETQFVQKLQGDQIQMDVRSLNRYEVEAPYSNLEQAVLDLLPFHVRSSSSSGCDTALCVSVPRRRRCANPQNAPTRVRCSACLPHPRRRLTGPQLFNMVEPAAADLDDTPDHMGADLTASRHDAWQELVTSKVCGVSGGGEGWRWRGKHAFGR